MVVLLAGLFGFHPDQTVPAGAGPTGGRVLDPTLAFDPGTNRWVSLSSGEALSSQDPAMCPGADADIQTRGWINVPFRTGPSPDKLRSC